MSRLRVVLRDRIPAGSLRGTHDLYNMLYIGFPLGEATFLTLGGPARWQGEQFTVAREVPGSPYSWAAALALCAVVLALGVLTPNDHASEHQLTARGWLIVTGALGIAVWCTYYAWCLYAAGQIYPTQVSLSGPYQWSFFALWYVIKVGQHLEFGHPREPT